MSLLAGSFAFLSQPIGSIFSTLFLEPHGRKRAMLLVNIPHVVGWLILYIAQSPCELYIGTIILGLGAILAPGAVYDGEICQHQWRGLLTSATGMFRKLPTMFQIYFLQGHSLLSLLPSVYC